MAATNILQTYGDVSAREDVVLNAIELLTPQETMIQKMLGDSVAINTVHSYLTDTLSAVGSGAVAEADDFSFNALTTPTRLTNIVEIIAEPIVVSRTQRDISHYHGEDELARQTAKAIKNWANKFEYDLLRGTLTSGASGTAAVMNGIIVAISKSTNTTVHTSGTVFSATILDGLMKLNWENSNGDVATDLFVGPYLRQVIDGFVQKSNIVVNNPGGMTKIVRTTITFETSFGTLTIHTHRYIQLAADATARVLAIRPEKLKIAYLKKPYIDTELARSGDYDRRAVVGKATLEVHNQDSNWFTSGFAKA